MRRHGAVGDASATRPQASDDTLRAFIGLGGNLGDVAQTLNEALAQMAQLPQTCVVTHSRFYRTPAWGGVIEQPAFVNAVAELSTTLSAQDLLAGLLEIERRAGRDRGDAQRWGPRSLDLDLLLYGDARIDEPGLRVPHPHMHERAFVLVPLMEISPDLLIPDVGSLRECIARVATDDIQALG